MTISSARSSTQSGTCSRMLDAGERLHARGEAFDVLDVDGAEDIDVVVEQAARRLHSAWRRDELPSLGSPSLVWASSSTSDDLGHAGEDGVDVHLGEEWCPCSQSRGGGFVRGLAAISAVPLRPWLSTMPMTTSSPRLRRRMPFAEHAEGLTDARERSRERP